MVSSQEALQWVRLVGTSARLRYFLWAEKQYCKVNAFNATIFLLKCDISEQIRVLKKF